MAKQTSVEEGVKGQFARGLRQEDWRLLKRMGEYYLEQAVFLKKTDVRIEEALRLLARNCQKRLFIGVGAELVTKAAFLRSGLAVNRPISGEDRATRPPRFRFRRESGEAIELSAGETYTFAELIEAIGE